MGDWKRLTTKPTSINICEASHGPGKTRACVRYSRCAPRKRKAIVSAARAAAIGCGSIPRGVKLNTNPIAGTRKRLIAMVSPSRLKPEMRCLEGNSTQTNAKPGAKRSRKVAAVHRITERGNPTCTNSTTGNAASVAMRKTQSLKPYLQDLRKSPKLIGRVSTISTLPFLISSVN